MYFIKTFQFSYEHIGKQAKEYLWVSQKYVIETIRK